MAPHVDESAEVVEVYRSATGSDSELALALDSPEVGLYKSGVGKRSSSSNLLDFLAEPLRLGELVEKMAAGFLAQCNLEGVVELSQLLTFLVTIQTAALSISAGGNETNFDPKVYVDIPLRKPLNESETAYDNLLANSTRNGLGVSNASFQEYLSTYFGPVGSELIEYQPIDFSPAPLDFLLNVTNKEVLAWAHQVHEIWLELSRVERKEVSEQPDLYTMLPLIRPFVVPGARFREVYYWDSYWVIRGLLVSKMPVTARGMVENLLNMIKIYGFVPNGARKYYLNRSQPPLLSEMVKSVFQATLDKSLLTTAVPILKREHSFWRSAPHVVFVRDSAGKEHKFARYYAKWDTPRPESAIFDEETASMVPDAARAQLYNDIASGAETGWDFSSRWFEDRQNLTTCRTTKILPCDLNAYIFQMEVNIASFAELLGDNKTAAEFSRKAAATREAIEVVMWNSEARQWNDYWLPADYCDVNGPVDFDPAGRNNLAYVSNYLPLWCGVLDGQAQETAGRVEGLMRALNESGLVFPAGIATSTIMTGQQWDFPNGWAPLQHMVIEGFDEVGAAAAVSAATEFAEDLASRWLKTNYATFLSEGVMVEKYDVRFCDSSGMGGEYAVQEGFGWTNGVALALLDRFGWPADKNISCSPSGGYRT